MLDLRQAAGLTQAELAQAIGVPQSNITHWEWSDKPPRADLLPRFAEILGTSVEEIIGSPRRRREQKPTPVGQLQRTFEEIRKLPRKQQRKIIETVTALIAQYNRKAS